MLSYLGLQVRVVHWLYKNPRDIVVKWRHGYGQVTSSYHVPSQCIQELLGAFFTHQNAVFNGEQERNPFVVWSWDRIIC